MEAAIGVAAYIFVELLLILRVMLRPHRDPASRVAWIAVIASLPVIGILVYLLFGEVNIRRRRIARLRKILATMPERPTALPGEESNLVASIPDKFAHLLRLGQSISGSQPVGGNSARLMGDSK